MRMKLYGLILVLSASVLISKVDSLEFFYDVDDSYMKQLSKVNDYFKIPRANSGLVRQRVTKRGRPCCSEFTSIFSKCCCHWLDRDLKEFDAKVIKQFRTQEGDNWTCNGCSKGYVCSTVEKRNYVEY